MASSSLSQESLDHDDFSLTNRRSRIKVVRIRASCPPLHNPNESVETTDKDVDIDDDPHALVGMLGPNNSTGLMGSSAHVVPGHVTFSSTVGSLPIDRDSPTRSKMKAVGLRSGTGMWGPGHVHKPKQMQVGMKDKRKLREKRRSCGLVPMHSTESTGDSPDENEKDSAVHKASTSEVIDADNPQTPEEDRKAFGARAIRNKSPSDLEADADLEDNQDYDSTFSQSETGSSRTHSTVRLQNLMGLTTSAKELTCGGSNTASAGISSVVSLSIEEKREPMGAEGGSEMGGGVAEPGDDQNVEDLLSRERERTRQLEELLVQKDQLINDLQQQINKLAKM